MQMNQKISWILIGVIFLAFLGGGWYFYQNLYQKVSDPLILIPDDVALFIEINDAEQLIEAISNSSAIEKALAQWPGLDEFQEFSSDLKSILSNKSESSQKMVIAFHSDGILFLISGAHIDFSALPISPDQINDKTYENEYYREITRNNKSLTVAEKRGVIFISNQPELLANSIKQLNSPAGFVHSREFVKLQKISGKRADAHVFIHFRFLNNWFGNHQISEPILNNMANMANWTGLDANIKSTELMLNGYSILSDTSNQFLKILEDQESVGMSISHQFPYETQSYVHLSLNNYEKFYQNWSNYLSESQIGTNYKKDIEKINKKLGKSPDAFHNQWWAGETAVLKTDDGKQYAVFLSKKGREAYKILSNLAHLSQPSLLTVDYNGHKIKELNFKSLLFTHFGPWFKDFKKSYFTIVGELVVFAHKLDDLKSYIDLLEVGYILQKNEYYTSFSDNLSPHLNYTFYINRPQSPGKILNIISNESNKDLAKTHFFTKDLSAFSLQMNWKNGMVYTGIFAGLKGKKRKSSSDWQVLLESNLIKGPYKVKDHTDGSHKYVVFDDYRQIYLINEQGDIVWKKQLKEKPISDVFEVDYYKNGKIQYLFNTPNYLYMIDLTGIFVKGFPIQLNSEASAGLALIDYNNDKDYRVLIPGKNGQVYNYQKDGSLLKDWKSKNTNKNIVKPIHHVVANSKDYLIAESSDGDAIMFNRTGKVRLEIRKSFENALGSDFYANRTNSKGMMITTDISGKLIYIPEKGKVKRTDFGDFANDHFFIYSDFTGDGNYDFLYLDQKELIVYNRFKKTIITYVFENKILQKPKIYTLAGRKILCVIDETAQKLYLFNSDGLITSNIKASGDYLIEVVKNKSFVLATSGKSLKKYPIR